MTSLITLALFIFNRQTKFIPSLLFFYTLTEYGMTIFELIIFKSADLKTSYFLTLVIGIVLKYLMNIIFLCFFIVKLKPVKTVEAQLQKLTKSSITILLFSILISSRLIKLIYSQLKGIRYFKLDIDTHRKLWFIISYVQLIPTILLMFNAFLSMGINRE